MTVDQDQLQALLARVSADTAATVHAATVVLGHKLGLYRALAHGPQSIDELAQRTGCHRRLVHEWLSAQVASGYCEYDPGSGHFFLTPEQEACLADEASPTFLIGGVLSANVVHRDEDKVRRVFTGDGAMGWHEHHHELSSAAERAFRGGYEANLASAWVPALSGVAQRLSAGGRVADVGCGHGSSTILLAKAFPASSCSGFDYHEPSVDAARLAAAAAGVSDRVTFEHADATALPGSGYDLVCLFNAFHEFGDPVAVARHIRSTLADTGVVMIVEPFAHDALPDNRTTLGRNFYSMSTMVCVPNALSQGATSALGAQAGEAALRRVLTEAGFGRVRRAAETPLHLVIEAMP